MAAVSVKRSIDPNLPIFYWTGVNNRFNCGKLKSFNVASQAGTERLDSLEIIRQTDPGVFVAVRVNLPHRGQLSLRTEFNAAPERLPPQAN